MRHRGKSSASNNIYESFSDVALLMLATFIFLLVTILITHRVAETYQVPKLKEELQASNEQLDKALKDKERLLAELGELLGMATETQIEQVLKSVGVGKKDFELFIDGLKKIPGKDIHLIIDATGSMHGVATFLVPVLRVMVVKSGKELSAITWFSDGDTDTYQGTMGAMFDQLLQGAPFVGNNETIGQALTKAAKLPHLPGAYVLIGDEPSDDRIHYSDIPRPVFTLPLGLSDPNTTREYSQLAEKTGGLMLHLQFK
ncbi:MAG: hypothetical protein GXP14_01565 [Gammaproteobacteria bacterium]|nr:hypothetical protein [Gammaproteobacteria bacterium]